MTVEDVISSWCLEVKKNFRLPKPNFKNDEKLEEGEFWEILDIQFDRSVKNNREADVYRLLTELIDKLEMRKGYKYKTIGYVYDGHTYNLIGIKQQDNDKRKSN